MMDYKTYLAQRARELGKMPISESEYVKIQQNMPNDYQRYVMQQTNGRLSSSDLQKVDTMPTYSNIYQALMSRLGMQ